MKALRIWLITVGEPLPLPGATARPWRAGILARQLASRGHKVTWWTSTVNHFTKEYFAQSEASVQVDENLELQFLHGDLYRKNISFDRLRNHRQIAKAFRRLAETRLAPDVVLCSFPTIELSFEAVSYCSSRGIPALLDIRDLWPDEIEARLPKMLVPLLRLAFPSMYRQVQFAMRNATGLLGVSQQYLEWGLLQANRPRNGADRVFIHGYPSPPANVSTAESHRILRELGIDPSRKMVCYIGTFVGSRDLQTVVSAAKALHDRADLQFVLAGSGEMEAELRALARGVGNVVFPGWLNQQQLAALASCAWVGLGPYQKDTRVSLTNKIFEYMAYGVPILLCLPGEARRLVESVGCGLYYEPGSAQSLESLLRQLLNSASRRNEMAQRALQAFNQDYSSEKVYTDMVLHLESMAGAAQPRPYLLER